MSLIVLFKRIFAGRVFNSKKTNKSEAASSAFQISSEANASSTKKSNIRFEHGRQYHEEENFHYILPTDIEENDRIHQQHWMLRHAFKGNYEAPLHEALNKGIVVLDAGCGPATWTLEMSETYPQSTFHGIDMAPVFPEKIKPPNCNFHLANLNDGIPFPDNSFDYVHQRLLIAGLTAENWQKILTELLRVLKPGGWIELKEIDLIPTSAGPKLQIFSDVLVNDILKAKGLCPTIARDLKSHLEGRDSLTNIKETVLSIPVNHGDKLGELHWADTKDVLIATKPLILKFRPDLFPDEAAFNEELEKTALECNEYKSFGNWYDVVAQKK